MYSIHPHLGGGGGSHISEAHRRQETAVRQMKRTALELLAAAGVVCGFGLEAPATSIDFNNAVGGSGNCVENSLHPCSGSHVNNTTDPNGFGTYGVGNGFTPNVEADY